MFVRKVNTVQSQCKVSIVQTQCKEGSVVHVCVLSEHSVKSVQSEHSANTVVYVCAQSEHSCKVSTNWTECRVESRVESKFVRPQCNKRMPRFTPGSTFFNPLFSAHKHTSVFCISSLYLLCFSALTRCVNTFFLLSSRRYLEYSQAL